MKIHQCPVCTSQRLIPFLQRSAVPVHQNLVVTSHAAARSVTSGELDLAACEECGFVFNRAFDLSLLAYGEDYDNTQTCSAYFDAYLDDLVKHLIEEQGIRNCTVVEVGCGKGQFLRKLINYPGANNRGFGFDPSYVGPETNLEGRLVFRRSYYDSTCTDVDADVVVCRHVIEHVPKPLALLHSVRAALEKSPNARVFFETPCVEWIFHHKVVWDFFYEHCSLFTEKSLSTAFERAGFSVTHTAHIFGGQYLWLEAKINDEKTSKTLKIPTQLQTTILAQDYGVNEENLRKDWLARIESLCANGKVALWGAGAKGATFANLIDPNCTLIDCVVDLNPKKQGCYIPGTGHPIVAPSDLPLRGIKYAVLMNTNYREENLQLLKQANISLELIDWSAS